MKTKESTNQLTFDLHNSKHIDIERRIINIVEENWNSNNVIKIITGNSKKMKEIVINILKEYKLDFEIGDFLGINKDMIIVRF